MDILTIALCVMLCVVLLINVGGTFLVVRRLRAATALTKLVNNAKEESRDFDPGPLDDEGLRMQLRRSWPIPSKTHDRVQDAFERLIQRVS